MSGQNPGDNNLQQNQVGAQQKTKSSTENNNLKNNNNLQN